MYSQLGDIRFEGLYGESEFVRKSSVSLPRHKRINRRPKQQFTGVDLDEIKITIRLNRSFIDVESAIDKFKGYRNTAAHLKYITGSGNIIGTFVIESTKEKRLQTTPLGDIYQAELEIKLIEVTSSVQRNDSVGRAIANRNNRPNLVQIPVKRPSPTMAVSAALNVTAAMSNASISNQLLTEASLVDVEEAESKVDQARSRVLEARERMADAAAQVQQAEETVDQASDYVNNMYTAAQNAQTLADAIDAFDPADPVGSLNAINDVNSEFMSGIAVMTNTSQPLASITGSRY